MNGRVWRCPACLELRIAPTLEGRRWWHGEEPWRRLVAALAMGLMAFSAHAACPPGAADGATVRKGDMILAYRSLPVAGTDAKPGRLPLAKHFALEVRLCDQDRATVARLIKADATMPEHRHGMNYRPVVKPLETGRFRVEGMMLHMAGRWELVFEVDTGREIVRLAHDVLVD